MTVFEYRHRVVDGEAEAFPELEQHIEALISEHRNMFHRILTGLGFVDWEVVFSPSYDLFCKWGMIAKPIKLIVIANHLVREGIILTFYHEIIHGLYPMFEDPSEEYIEAMAQQWYAYENEQTI